VTGVQTCALPILCSGLAVAGTVQDLSSSTTAQVHIEYLNV